MNIKSEFHLSTCVLMTKLLLPSLSGVLCFEGDETVCTVIRGEREGVGRGEENVSVGMNAPGYNLVKPWVQIVWGQLDGS